MQPLNQQVIIRQLEQLLVRLQGKNHLAGDITLGRQVFDVGLFPQPRTHLSQYLGDCLTELDQLKGQSGVTPRFQWQVERLTARCQALVKVITAPNSLPPPTISKEQELAGYERRLIEKVARLQAAASSATTLPAQQQFLHELTFTEQRLARCQAAQHAQRWRNLLSD